MSFEIEVIGSKNIGDRDQQQDDFFYELSETEQKALCVIADGMGGHTGGKIASSCLTVSAKLMWEKEIHKGMERSHKDVLKDITLQAYKKMKKLEKKDDISPRSTCVILLIDKNTAHYCHLGDSRLYHFRKGKFLERTKDHSVVQMLVEMGEIKEEEMGVHEDQGRLLKWVGGKNIPEPTYKSVELEEGDQFLLCSDGLWEYLSVSEMEKSLKSRKTIIDVLKYFISTARQRAKPNGDNVSLILCSISEKRSPSHFRALTLGIMLLLVSVLALIHLLLESLK